MCAPRPVRVVHVVPSLSVGGMELAMSRIIHGMPRDGFEHTVVCLKGEGGGWARQLRLTQVYNMYAVPNDPRLPWRLWRLLRHCRPNVIHARNWGAWPDVALARLLFWPPIPLVFSFHGLDRAGQMPLRRRLAFRVLAGITTRVFTVSEGAKRYLVDEVGLSASRIQVIPNGVDTKRFSPGPPRTRGGRLVVGTVGSLTPVKNQALLLRSCAALAGHGVDWELRLAGKGPWEARLRQLAAHLGVTERVRFHGAVEEVPAFLRDLDLFALPSDTEAHPNALLEAMACGLPCVASGIGGVPEVLAKGQCGIIVAPGEQAALTHQIVRLARDGELARRLGIAARERVRREYSLEGMLQAYERLYREVAGRRKGRCRW